MIWQEIQENYKWYSGHSFLFLYNSPDKLNNSSTIVCHTIREEYHIATSGIIWALSSVKLLQHDSYTHEVL